MNQPLPVFIGNFRSGTTLLANLLSFHGELAPWFETKAFCEALRWIRVLERPNTRPFESRLIQAGGETSFTAKVVAQRMREDFRQTAARISGELESGKGRHEVYPMGHDRVAYLLNEAERELDQWYEGVRDDPGLPVIHAATGQLISNLGALHAARSGRSIWVNKTPEIPRFAHELRRCIGPCRIVMMMRESSEVVRSAVSLGWAEAHEIAGWWHGMVNESREAALEDPVNYREIQYDALLHDPITVLNELLEFIGVRATGDQLVEQFETCLPPAGRSLLKSVVR
jgi:hypothetical protein